MNSIKCHRCGLTNWATAESCKRCGDPLLASNPVVDFSVAATSEKANRLSKKWFLALILLAIPLGIWSYTRARNEAIFSAIQKSGPFNEPLTLEVYKTPYGEGGDAANAEAMTLRDVGFMNIEEKLVDMLDPRDRRFPREVICTWNDALGMTVCPPVLPAEQQRWVKYKTLTFTFPVGSDIRDWKPFEMSKAPYNKGWIIPIGGRQLVELTGLEWFSNAPLVHFTWSWEPNQVGKYFDAKDDPPGLRDGISTGAYVKPKSSQKISSAILHNATARLLKTANGWEVKEITWQN